MLNAISYWATKEGLAGTYPIADAVNDVKAAGFEAIELCIAPDGALNVDHTEADCQAIRKTVDASGLQMQTIASGMSWGANPVSNDPTVREKSVILHERALERTAWLGCDAMLYVPGVVSSPISPNENVRYDHAIERARENVTRLLKTAERVGVDLCIENVWNGMFYSPLEFADFIDSFGSDRLGIYFDVGNVMGYQQHPPHWIELLGQRIKRVHVKGYKENFGFDGTFSFCGLGEGDVPLVESLKSLKAIGYDKTIVAEQMPWHETLLDETSKTLSSAIAEANA